MKAKTLIGIAVGGLAARWLITRATAAVPVPQTIPLQGLGNVGFIGCAPGVGCSPTLMGLGCNDLGQYVSPEVENAWSHGLYGYTSPLGESNLGRFNLKKSVQKFVAPVQKFVAPVVKQARRDVKTAVRIPVQATKKAVNLQVQGMKSAFGQARAVFGRDPLTGKLWQKKATATQAQDPATGQPVTIYQDANGNQISEEQYNALMASDASVAPVTAENAPPADDMVSTGADGQVVSSDVRADSEWNQPVPDRQYDTQATQAGDQAWRGADRGFVDDQMLNAGGMQSPGEGAIYDGGLWWFQESDGSWSWYDERAGQWVVQEPDGGFVGEEVSDEPMEPMPWGENGGDKSLGALVNTRTGRRMAFVTTMSRGYGKNKVRTAHVAPLMADRRGNVFAQVKQWLRKVGHVDQMAEATGQAGLGFKVFGRTFNNFDAFAKDIAGKITPSGALYKYVKYQHPKAFKESRREVKSATPYAAIAAGAVVSVASLGTATPLGVALIAAGVAAEAGAQGYKDYKSHQIANGERGAAGEVAELNAQAERDNKAVEQARLDSAGDAAVASNRDIPFFDANWWTGDVPEDDRLTYGEKVS